MRNAPVAGKPLSKKKTKKKTAKKVGSGGLSKSSKKIRTKKTTTKKTVSKPGSAPTSRKKTAKKAPIKKPVAKKPVTKKSSSTKSVVKKSTAKKPVVKKTSAKKPAPKKSSAGTPNAKRVPAKNTTAKNPKAKTPTTKKTGTKKKTTRKPAARGRGAAGSRSVAEAASAAKADAEGYVFINGRRVRMISTGGQSVTRKTRAPKQDTPVPIASPEKEKPVKTTLTPKELRYYKSLLLLKRGELVGSLSAMEEAALQMRGGSISNLPIHMADIGTDTYDQDFMLGLAETERNRLREIDDAIRRIEDKTYGVCKMTGNPIPKARLEAKPWAQYTIEAARQVEGQWRP